MLIRWAESAANQCQKCKNGATNDNDLKPSVEKRFLRNAEKIQFTLKNLIAAKL